MNFTGDNLTAIKLDLGTAISRNSRTLNNPIVGLLLAAGILARVAQAKQNAATFSSTALANPWLQLQSISSPVQIAPSRNGVQFPYGYYSPPYPLAAPQNAYPWWYAIEPFSLYPPNGHHPQVIHTHGESEEHEEHKDGGINYSEDHEEEQGQQEHPHHNSHELEAGHSAENGEHSAPGSYEAESENVDKQVAANEIPILPSNQVKPVVENVEETKLKPVAIETVDTSSSTREASLNDGAVLPTPSSATTNGTLLNEATRTVQNIVTLLHKFDGNYSRVKTSEPLKQRPNQHQLVLQNQKYSLPKNSVTNILVQLNTTSASELQSEDDDRFAEASDMNPVLEGTPPLIWAMAETSNTMRRQYRPNDKQPSGGRKRTSTTRRPPINKNQNRQKPPQRKPTTPRMPVAPTYDDEEYEYEYTTPRYKPTRRPTARRKPDNRRSTAPPRRYDDYDYDNYPMRTQNPVINRRKQGSVNIYNNRNRNKYNNRIKPTTVSAYNDDFDDAYGNDPSQYYPNDDYAYRPAPAQAQIDYADYRYDKDNDGNENGNDNDNENDNGFVARQQTQAPDDESTTEPASSSSESSTETTSTTSQAPTTVNVTAGPTGYPYGPGSNISFTYGPPVQPHQPGYGYGPSNGNENISITYGPPTADGSGGDASGTAGGGTANGGSPHQYIAAGAPSLDWYNQYTKQNVFKRIQDLLAPNNFYSPQYDSDKYNYNDNTF